MNRVSFCNKYISALAILVGFMSALGAQAATKGNSTIVGIVRDAHTKQPVNAAQVTVANKKLSTTTDEKGHFTLKNSANSDVLTVSAYDYNTTETALRGRDSLVIELYSDQFSGYFNNVTNATGEQRNSSLITPASSINELGETNFVSVDEMMQQTLGGNARTITRSGVSGIGASMFIRGINSLNANAQPLYVIDGVVWDSQYDKATIHEGFFSNPLDNIVVSDIESVTLLKDGNTIYGSKGANGVILIRTRRARDMVTKISLNMSTGYTSQPGTIPMMNGEQYRVFANDLYGSAGAIGTNISAMPFLESDQSKAIYKTYHNNTDWAKQVYQTGYNSNYLINATGGDEKALYYFSLGYTDNKGVVKNTDMQRLNARFNADIKMTRALTMELNIGFTRTTRKLQDDGINDYSSPTWLSQVKSPFLSPNKFTLDGEKTTDIEYADIFGIGNPAGVIAASINKFEKDRFNIAIAPNLQIAPGLSLSSRFDYSIDKTVEGHFIPYGFTAKRILPGKGVSENMISGQSISTTTLFDDTRLTFEKNFGAANHLKAMYGWRYLSEVYSSDYLEEHNSRSNSKTTITGGYDFLLSTGNYNDTKSLSNYVNVDYDFNKKYFLNAGVTVDGSSRFGTETKDGLSLFGKSWGVFPAVNAGWIVSSEKFMKHLSLINFLKIRGGYNVTGNDDIEDYAAMAYFKSVRFMQQGNGLTISNLANTKVQWETTGKTNIGFDLSMLKDRVSLSFDYYSGKTTNLLNMKQSPDITGLGYYWINGGEMTNNGYEVSAGIKLLNFKNVKWEIGATAGHYINKITALPDGDYNTPVMDGEVRTAVGHAAGSFYGYKTKGVFSTETDAATAHNGTSYLSMTNTDGSVSNFGAGDIHFEDVNNDGIIDAKDKQFIGNPNPDVYGTFTSKFSVRRFTLGTVFSYSYGNDVYNYFRSQLESGKNFNNQTIVMNNRWTADGQTTSQPKAVYGDPMQNARFSDRWIEDGSYLRLKTITLSYNLPLKSSFMEGFNIWISANNLVTFTKYLGLDPEFSSRNSVYYQGVDAGLIPLTKSYNIGFKFNL